ncbi:MAG: flagellar basal body-associated FliL family protein, partial [Desulforhopalus sp.]
MAEKEDTTTVNGSNYTLLLIIIIAVLVILLIGGGASAWYFLRERPSPQVAQLPSVQVSLPQAEERTEIGPMVDIDEFIVNIISGDSAHYVKASLT